MIQQIFRSHAFFLCVQEPAAVSRQFSVLSTEDDFGLGAAAVAARPIIDSMNAVRGVFGDGAAGVRVPSRVDRGWR
jgi:hypothetical protein